MGFSFLQCVTDLTASYIAHAETNIFSGVNPEISFSFVNVPLDV